MENNENNNNNNNNMSVRINLINGAGPNNPGGNDEIGRGPSVNSLLPLVVAVPSNLVEGDDGNAYNVDDGYDEDRFGMIIAFIDHDEKQPVKSSVR